MKYLKPQEIWVTVSEASELTGLSERHLRRNCQIERFTSKVVKGIGGDQYTILLSSLPIEAQVRYQNLNKPEPEEKTVPRLLNKKEERELNLKLSFLQGYKDFADNNPYRSKVEAKKAFIDMHNKGNNPERLKELGELTFKTVERWLKTMKESGPEALLRKKITERSTVSTKEAEILITRALNPNGKLISEVIRESRILIEMQGINPKSDKTYREFVNKWKENNADIWQFQRNGMSGYNNNSRYYITRDYSKISVGDILVADGHNLNFEIINPYTGAMKRMTLILFSDMKSSMPLGWEISPTENTSSISMALYRSILFLGKMPKCVYVDNGKAFGSKYFKGKDLSPEIGKYKLLGINTITAWPYHGQSKPIERMFETFAELERRMPTYSGTSIENKPARMNRGEVLHRQLYDKIVDKSKFDLFTAHQAIASWFDEYSKRPQTKGHLKGLSPWEVFVDGRGQGIDKLKLANLLMGEEERQLNRGVVILLGEEYTSEELIGRRHKVSIRYDLNNREEILVYDERGNFICIAKRKPKVHPAAFQLGSKEDQELFKSEIMKIKRNDKNATSGARAFLQSNMLEDISRTTAQAEEIRKQAELIKKEEAREIPSYNDVDFSVEEPENKDDNPYKDLDFGISGIA